MWHELFKGVPDCIGAVVRIYFVASYRCMHYVIHLPSYNGSWPSVRLYASSGLGLNEFVLQAFHSKPSMASVLSSSLLRRCKASSVLGITARCPVWASIHRVAEKTHSRKPIYKILHCPGPIGPLLSGSLLNRHTTLPQDVVSLNRYAVGEPRVGGINSPRSRSIRTNTSPVTALPPRTRRSPPACARSCSPHGRSSPRGPALLRKR
jgi:hypothetical protein